MSNTNLPQRALALVPAKYQLLVIALLAATEMAIQLQGSLHWYEILGRSALVALPIVVAWFGGATTLPKEAPKS